MPTLIHQKYVHIQILKPICILCHQIEENLWVWLWVKSMRQADYSELVRWALPSFLSEKSLLRLRPEGDVTREKWSERCTLLVLTVE